jgi:CRISPR subtype II RNA-guided endonuclease Cas9/Csn1
MNKEKVVLGLDIGVGSIGWGLVKIREEEYSDEKADGTIDQKHRIIDGEIIDTGVRAFQIPQDRQKKSLALQRGTARRSRKTTRRKAQRLKRLIRLAKEFNLIDEIFGRDKILKPKKGDKESNWDIWAIRKQALERTLTDIELFRVLYHIAKHRGFFFRTKAEEIQDDNKTEEGKEKAKVKKGLQRIREMLRDGKYITVGQMFYEKFKQTNSDSKRKRNAPDKYENSIHRSLLKEEIEVIFEKQQEFGSSKAKDELKQRYIDEILMHEEEIDDDRLQKMMSKCEFTGKLCAPKEGYTSERFTLFNRLNTLELVDTKNKDRNIQLDDEQREKIIALAYKNAKVTFAQIRKELKFQDDLHIRFNLCSYGEKNPEYNKKLVCSVKDGRLEFGGKHKIKIVDINTGEITVLDKEIKEIFKKRKESWQNAKSLYVYYSEIRKQLNLSGDYRFSDLKGYTKSATELDSEAKYIKQFEGDTFIELKGYHKLKRTITENCGDKKWTELASDIDKLDIIAEALVYHKSDSTRIEYMKDKGIIDKDIINAVLTINMKQLANHSKEAIRKLLVFMEKEDLFNEAKEKAGFGKIVYDKQAILQPYSGFFENNPAVARVVSQTRKLINALVRKYNDKYPLDQIHIEVATELANSKKRRNEIEQGQRRYRDEKKSAEERCREKGLDPEEGQNLLMFRLAEQQMQLCPYSRKHITFHSTGANNEVYIFDCEIDHIIPMSLSFNDSLKNKVLCTQKANQDKKDRIPCEWFEDMYGKDSKEWNEFENRVKKMYGMPYPKRKNLLRKSWTEKDKERFLSRNLNDTRYAEREIAKYLRKHFDFSKSKRDDINPLSRIQVRSGGITSFLRYMWGLTKDRSESDLHHATDALVTACSTNGHVYLVSNLARDMERKGKNWYKHFKWLRDKFKPWGSIREDIQKAVGNVFVSRMPRHTVTAAAHEETIISGDKRDKKRTLNVRGGFAKMGDMVRADVFVDKEGRNYVVPIYSVDIFRNKPLPDKYVPDDYSLSYEQWPSVKDGNLKFRFSIFKDDLLSINGTIYYVSFFEASTVNVNVKNVDGSIFSDKKDATDPYTKKICYRPKRKGKKFLLKKYSVDMLGNYKEIKQEKRIGKRLKSGV